MCQTIVTMHTDGWFTNLVVMRDMALKQKKPILFVVAGLDNIWTYRHYKVQYITRNNLNHGSKRVIFVPMHLHPLSLTVCLVSVLGNVQQNSILSCSSDNETSSISHKHGKEYSEKWRISKLEIGWWAQLAHGRWDFKGHSSYTNETFNKLISVWRRCRIIHWPHKVGDERRNVAGGIVLKSHGQH